MVEDEQILYHTKDVKQQMLFLHYAETNIFSKILFGTKVMHYISHHR